MPRSSLIICCEMLTAHQLLSETPGPPSRAFSTVPSPNNNLWLPLRDSWGLLSHPAASYILFLIACSGHPVFHTAFFCLKHAALVLCGPAATSPLLTMTSTIPTTISSSCLRTLALCPICLTVWTMLMCFTLLLAADLPWTYLLSHSIILLPLSLVLSLTILSSSYFERCSHIDVLSSSPASWLAQCGFSCLEYCVRPSQSVISRASLTLREAGTCATRSCICCLYLRACTICSIASLLSLWCLRLLVFVLRWRSIRM